MAHLDTNRHIYYYVLQGTSNILSDERDKKKLLDIILSVRRERDFELYAFCLTDEEVFLLAGVVRQAKLERAVRVISAEYAAYYEKKTASHSAPESGASVAIQLDECMRIKSVMCRRADAVREISRMKVVWKERLNHVQEVRNRCRAIHYIPVDRGYVGRIRDYWWSSYRTYLGYYEWKMLDTLPMLRLFAPEPEKARKQFRRFHELLIQKNFRLRAAEKQLLLDGLAPLEDGESIPGNHIHLDA